MRTSDTDIEGNWLVSHSIVCILHGSHHDRTTIPENPYFEWNGPFTHRVQRYWYGRYCTGARVWISNTVVGCVRNALRTAVVGSARTGREHNAGSDRVDRSSDVCFVGDTRESFFDNGDALIIFVESCQIATTVLQTTLSGVMHRSKVNLAVVVKHDRGLQHGNSAEQNIHCEAKHEWTRCVTQGVMQNGMSVYYQSITDRWDTDSRRREEQGEAWLHAIPHARPGRRTSPSIQTVRVQPGFDPTRGRQS